MHRFYADSPISGVGAQVSLNAEESAHAARVLRLQVGEKIRLLDGENLWAAELIHVDAKETVAAVTAQCPSPEAPARAVLWQGLPKADKLELIAQKGTELGMWELWPVEMERSVAKADRADKAEKKRERLQRIAMEAAKQSGRAHVPEIAAAVPFAKALTQLEAFDLVLVAWEDEHALSLSRAVAEHVSAHGAPERVLIVIGPEGGISEAEWKRLREAGAVSVTLGSRILRTETAGLCALSVLWTALGEM